LKYYKSNAVYDNLEMNSCFSWVSGNAWILIYGDYSFEPKLIVFVHGSSWKIDDSVLSYVSSISSRTSVPAIRIEFDDLSNEIEFVKIHKGSGDQLNLQLDDLKKLFFKYGVPVNDGLCVKAVNDSTSSAYHNWQRSFLGTIVVSDVDLIKIKNESVEALVELKRSFVSLDKWMPYKADYPNFRLISNLCDRGGFKFFIAYNVRHTRPLFFDDVSFIKLFDFDAGFNLSQVSILNFKEFSNGLF